MRKRDGLAWYGGHQPPPPAEGMVSSIGLNQAREGQAIDPDAPPSNRVPTGPKAPILLDRGALEDGPQVEVHQLGTSSDGRPNGRMRLPPR